MKTCYKFRLEILGNVYISGVTKPGLWKTPVILLDNPFGEGKIFSLNRKRKMGF